MMIILAESSFPSGVRHDSRKSPFAYEYFYVVPFASHTVILEIEPTFLHPLSQNSIKSPSTLSFKLKQRRVCTFPLECLSLAPYGHYERLIPAASSSNICDFGALSLRLWKPGLFEELPDGGLARCPVFVRGSPPNIDRCFPFFPLKYLLLYRTTDFTGNAYHFRDPSVT